MADIVGTGDFKYRVTPMFMDAQDKLSTGEPQEVAIQLARETYPGIANVTFTRGFVSSQAFVDRYVKNGPINTLVAPVAAKGLDFTPTHPDSTAALAWMFAEWIVKGKPSVLGIISGAVAGLVAITPASGFVDPRGALIIGIAAGVICYWATTGLKHAFGYDDSLDVFGVHGVGGATGALLTGVLAVAWVGGEGKSGLIDGNPNQVLTQLYGIGVVALYDAIASLILLKLVDLTIGLRVESDIEREGLDLAVHGEAVH